MALRKKNYAMSAVIIVFVVLLAFLDSSTGQESKVNDISGNIFFTNSTAEYKIENVVTHWRVGYPNQLQFNFSMYEEPSKIIYSLDDQANLTESGNFTIADLSEGIHYLTLYVTDKSGNAAYQTYHVSLPDPSPFDESPFFLIPVLGLFAIVTFPIILYKRNQRKSKLINN